MSLCIIPRTNEILIYGSVNAYYLITCQFAAEYGLVIEKHGKPYH